MNLVLVINLDSLAFSLCACFEITKADFFFIFCPGNTHAFTDCRQLPLNVSFSEPSVFEYVLRGKKCSRSTSKLFPRNTGMECLVLMKCYLLTSSLVIYYLPPKFGTSGETTMTGNQHTKVCSFNFLKNDTEWRYNCILSQQNFLYSHRMPEHHHHHVIIRCQIWNRHWRPCLSKHLCHRTTS